LTTLKRLAERLSESAVKIAINYVEEALTSGRAVFHAMGDHAGEPPEVFIPRKQADIADLGYTYWYARSLQPPNARSFSENRSTFVLFYETKPKHRRTRHGKSCHAGEPTSTKSERFGYMTEFCEGDRDCDRFLPLPEALRQPGGYVTGRVDAGSCGLKFDYLHEVSPDAAFNPTEWKSVFKKSSQAGVWCATKCESKLDQTWYIVAVARLCTPYAVWFRGNFGVPPK
jgi:hypothetical protein